MQTFLPFPHFEKSLSVLDSKRLGKQRVECLQMLNNQWADHAASVMWRGHHDALRAYAQTAVRLWTLRGMRNTLDFDPPAVFQLPWWFGNPLLHRSHQLRLMEKSATFYSSHFNPRQPDDLWGYVWPQESGSSIRKVPMYRPLPRRLQKQRDLLGERFPHLSGLHVLNDPYGKAKAYGFLVRYRTNRRSYWTLQSHTTGKDAKPVCYITEDLA